MANYFPLTCKDGKLTPIPRTTYVDFTTEQETAAAVKESIRNGYNCAVCDTQSNKANISRHVTSHFSCYVGLCGMVSATKQTIDRHYKRVHKDTDCKQILKVDKQNWNLVRGFTDVDAEFPALPAIPAPPRSQWKEDGETKEQKAVTERILREL